MQEKSLAPLRAKLLIDRDVQGTLLIRALLYSGAGAIYLACMLYLPQILSDTERPWSEHVADFLVDMLYWAPGLVVLVPIMMHDILRTSNRFAGPIYRLNSEMRLLADGQESRPVKFRDGDHWNELSESYNSLRAELLALRKANADRIDDDFDAKDEDLVIPPPNAASDSPKWRVPDSEREEQAAATLSEQSDDEPETDMSDSDDPETDMSTPPLETSAANA